MSSNMTTPSVNMMASNNWAEERFDDMGILRFSTDGRPLEYAVRAPIKNPNWYLIRRLKMAPFNVIAKTLPEAERVLFLEKEEALLDILEERKTLAMYIEEIKSTRRWYGLKFHFRNLVVDSDDMEDGNISTTSPSSLVWLDSPKDRPNPSNGPPFGDQDATTTNDRRESPAAARDSSDGPSDDADDDSATPVANGNMVLFQSNPFRPSYAINGARPPTNPAIAQLAVNIGVGIQPNYEGEVTDAHLADRLCPENMNTSVYIKYVDPASTAQDIFDCVREGGIFKYSRQEPTGDYTTAAVTVTFKHRQAAQRFISRAQTEHLQIRGRNVQVIPSLNPSWGIEPGRAYQTRVLEVVAPAENLDGVSLEAELHNNIRFNLVKREEWTQDGYKTIHFHFESIHAQSRAAAMYLKRTHSIPGLTYQFVADPCALDGP
ncbi:hypothetical protein VTL71DRAFT_7314 [Oculimacula yallundae]|uniref:RRM domain-containing protein n=1 Tax=Oculimacula yallundae TaxID=86028 RepID=A0ABR4BXT0_9HELO